MGWNFLAGFLLGSIVLVSAKILWYVSACQADQGTLVARVWRQLTIITGLLRFVWLLFPKALSRSLWIAPV